ncbi:MAG: hypothetical protein C0631_02780 [Sedimenticola sp.]|nr:MAG: hypothetical protein C0631_02780 [Sedimenticola sp.]
MLKHLPLRSIISIPYAVLIIAVVALVGLLSYKTGEDALEQSTHVLRNQTYQQIHQHLDTFLETPHRVNQLNRNFTLMGALDLDDPDAQQKYFLQQLKVFDSVSYIYFGNTQGGISLAAKRVDGTEVVRQTDDFIAGRSTVYSLNADGTHDQVLEKREFYDSRSRPWYKSAVEKGAETWSVIYPFFLDRALGITASLPVYHENGELKGVLGTDILLSHIGNYLKKIGTEQSCEIFIFEPSGLLVASSVDFKPYRLDENEKKLVRISAIDAHSPLIRAAYKTISDNVADLGNVNGILQSEFELDGHKQFLQLTPFHDSRGLDWLIAIAVPEAGFLSSIQRNIQVTIVLCLSALIIAIVLSLIVAHWIAKPLSGLKQAVTSLEQGNWGETVPASRVEELDALSTAFNTMSLQLQALFLSLKRKNKKLNQAREQLSLAHSELESKFSEQNDELKESEERYRRLSQAAFEGIVIHINGVIVDCNHAVETLLGFKLEEVIGRNVLEFVAPDSVDKTRTQLAYPVDGLFEIKVVNNRGEHLIVEARGTATPYKGDSTARVVVMRDITASKQLEQTLRILATTDSLTNILNRRQFHALATNEIRKASRLKHAVSLLVIDIDHFKRINDNFGHAVGDEVLKSVAVVCQGLLRDFDVFGRIGGEEFAVLLPGTDNLGAKNSAERLRSAVSSSVVAEGDEEMAITVSIGIATLSEEISTLEALFKQADENLYEAKNDGRDRVFG